MAEYHVKFWLIWKKFTTISLLTCKRCSPGIILLRFSDRINQFSTLKNELLGGFVANFGRRCGISYRCILVQLRSKLCFNLDAQLEIQILNRLWCPSDLVSNTSNNASPKSKVNEESFLLIFITVPLNKLSEKKISGMSPMFLPHLLSQKNRKYPNCSQSLK